GPVVADDPIFATTLVQYVGQSIFAVAAHTVEQARRAARLAVIEYEDLKPILTAEAAVRAHSFVLPTERMQRGNPAAAIAFGTHPRRRAGAVLPRRNDCVRGAEGRWRDAGLQLDAASR